MPRKTRAWFLTWNNPPADAVDQVIRYSETEQCTYVCQIESGTLCTKHLQGCIRFKNPRANWPNINSNIHWEKCRNWRSACKYCSKLDTRVSGPFTNVKNLRFRRTVRDPLDSVALYSWQESALQILECDPKDREIFWFWDRNGNTGKTSLAKHIRIKYGLSCVLCQGASRDIFKLVADRSEKNIDIKIVIFLLTRADENRCSYRAIESIKDGLCVSTKYEPIDLYFNTPHVFIFGNFPPQCDLISNDRWKIINVSNK